MTKLHGLWVIAILALVGSIGGIALSLNPITEGASKSQEIQVIEELPELIERIDVIEKVIQNPELSVKAPKEDVFACVFPGNTDENLLRERENKKLLLEDKVIEERLNLELAMVIEPISILREVESCELARHELIAHIETSNLNGNKFPMPVEASMQAVLSSPVIIPCDMSKKADGRIEIPTERIKRQILENPELNRKVEEIRKMRLGKGELVEAIDKEINLIYEKIAVETKAIYEAELLKLRK